MILDIFDAVQEGTFDEFMSFYDGHINQVSDVNINLLNMTLTSNSKLNEKLRMIEFLIKEGIDVNFLDRNKRNALHNFFQYKANWRPDISYAIKVVTLLLKSGVNVNQIDRFGNIPMIYAITVLKLSTEEAMPLYLLLLNKGSDITIKNLQGKSVLDYVHETSWRNNLLSSKGGPIND
ncbi:ankyrin repeat domain-containing protein [Streptococcus sp. CSL10205-OR2]|uniref:ankyrin repeat domain-containing protein n=1 Tax=Streptococcus sp. CSL10205-OR2 TaxID=2980558 RepID=UPI0021D9A2B4|nr:ankyrin repeat domain-containing protein [Streptococcus sp. CSL10205-OR2]MCU9533314.1 ankyrin repeat domain-containing protein [Streptococcus sp. CSL10205-OR2]